MGYLEKIAQLIREGVPVVIWGATHKCINPINRLKHRYGVCPVAIIDSDSMKQGKTLLGLPVVSFQDARSRYPNMHIMITAGDYKHQIIGTLINNEQFPKECIVNYEPVVWKRSCLFMNCDMQSVFHRCQFCCGRYGMQESPYIIFEGEYDAMIEKWTSRREEICTAMEKNEPSSCEGCSYIKESYYPAQPMIYEFNYSDDGVCNYRCAYCDADQRRTHSEYVGSINMKELFEALERKELVSDDLQIAVGCGEPTLHRDRSEIFRLLENCESSNVMTNASIYDEELAEQLRKDNTVLLVSLDAGTRETYRAIKGIDTFERVRDNLKRYARQGEGVVELKYIFTPDINDDKENIDGFLQLCGEINPGMVFISYDFNNPVQTISEQTFSMVKYMIGQLNQKKILWKNMSDVIARAISSEGI